MDGFKVSPQEIYEVLEEQQKLLEIKSKLSVMVEKINQSINSLAVENLQLTQNIELSDSEEPPKPDESKNSTVSSEHPTYSYNQQEQSEIINQQMIEIDLKPCYNNEEIESDEEIDHL